jgi:hypothetical protein
MRFALDALVARAASEKRRQSRRTPKWAGLAGVGARLLVLGAGGARFAHR